MTLPEGMLWNAVRGGAIGTRVRRQHPIGSYIVDFYVPQARLVVEVDGESHNRGELPERDERRDQYLRDNGYRVLRVMAVDVLRNIQSVVDAISAGAADPHHHPSDGPPPRTGEDMR
jgi:very-short-patch-repair endonuclease